MASIAGLTTHQRDAFDLLVDNEAQQHHVPTLFAALAVDGVIVHSRSIAAPGHPTANEQSVYRIASMTKSFTAAAVLLLRDEGLLALDDPVSRFVPALANRVYESGNSPTISIRHLLTMSAGFATDDPWADRQLASTVAWFDQWLANGITAAFPPGVAMQYSNTGYALLGRVVAAAAGQSCQSLITDRLLVPLGMHRSAWTMDQLPDGTDVVSPYVTRDEQIVAESAPLSDGVFAPMGGLWSSAEDIAAWTHFLSSAFADTANDSILSPASRREMQQVHRSFEPPPITELNGVVHQIGLGYGMGLNVLHHTGMGKVVAHSGGLPGYGSNMRWLPGRGIAVVAFGNTTYAPMSSLTAALLDSLHQNNAIPPSPITLDATLRHRIDELIELINDWSPVAATALFAENVHLDEPLERRAAAARALSDTHGYLTAGQVTALSATEADVVIESAGSPMTLSIQLSPEVPPRVQWYEIDMAAETD